MAVKPCTKYTCSIVYSVYCIDTNRALHLHMRRHIISTYGESVRVNTHRHIAHYNSPYNFTVEFRNEYLIRELSFFLLLLCYCSYCFCYFIVVIVFFLLHSTSLERRHRNQFFAFFLPCLNNDKIIIKKKMRRRRHSV